MNLRCLLSSGTVLLALTGLNSLHGQQYAIDWFTIDGGGGTSTGGVYSVTGTIGQPDAGHLSGGNYTVDGGFWGVIAVVQMPGAPLLSVSRTTTNTVLLSWLYPSTGFALQQNGALDTTNWTSVTNLPAHVGDQSQVILPPPAGNRYYRLIK